jgi:outer membrane protein
MKKRLIVILFTTFLVIPYFLNAQTMKTDSTYKMSLTEVQDYAIQNSPAMKNSVLDLEIANKKIWETTAIGLPQVNGKFSYSYMLKLSPTIEQFSSFSDYFAPIYSMFAVGNMQWNNPYIAHVMDSLSNASQGNSSGSTSVNDLKWGLSLDVTATQLLFSGAYLVGVQYSKVFRKLAEIALTKSEADLKLNVTNAYFIVLIAEENVKVLDSTYTNTSKLLIELEAILKAGLIEETDVDQLKITVNSIKNALEMLKRQTVLAKNLLKYQIGMDLYSDLILTDDLNAMIDIEKTATLLLQKYDLKNQPEFSLIETQEKIANINVKYNKSLFLPDIAAFYTHNKNFNDKALSFTPPDLIGVGMSIPIFSSGSRIVKLKQAKLGLYKAQNNTYMVEQGLLLEYEQAKAACLNALDKFNTQKESIKLSKKIYDRTLIKYKEGMSSSMELTQVQNQYLTTQSAYFNAMLELLSANAKLNKLLSTNKQQ